MASLWKGRQILAEALGRADATHSDSIQSLDRVRRLSPSIGRPLSLVDAKARQEWDQERPSQD